MLQNPSSVYSISAGLLSPFFILIVGSRGSLHCPCRWSSKARNPWKCLSQAAQWSVQFLRLVVLPALRGIYQISDERIPAMPAMPVLHPALINLQHRPWKCGANISGFFVPQVCLEFLLILSVRNFLSFGLRLVVALRGATAQPVKVLGFRRVRHQNQKRNP